MVHTFLTFTYTDFPDDAVEEDGEIVRMGGLNVTETLVEMIRAGGYDVTDPEADEDHGWLFDARGKGREHYEVLVTAMCDEGLMTCRNVTPFLFIPTNGRHERHVEFVSHLQRAMEADSRFANLLWFKNGRTYTNHLAPGTKTALG
jgi:hypothetical protein